MSVRVGLGVLAAVAAATAVSIAPAHADDTVVVRGTAFPDDRVQLSFVGCTSVYDRTDEVLRPRIGRGPDLSPAGRRSLGYTLDGGNAVGAVVNVASLAGAGRASLAVHALEGARGVAYAGFQEAVDAGTNEVWFGRADLTATAATWQDVDATRLSYVWTKYDAATGQAIEPGPSGAVSVSDFVAAHGGDGPGLYSIGFGCDGRPFSMDAVRVGAAGSQTTYDLEGLLTATTMVGEQTVVRAGESVDLRGSLDVIGGIPVPNATLLLEQRVGEGQWWPVEAVDAADPVVTVTPTQRTVYRWRFVDRPLAEGSLSAPFVVDVLQPPPLPEPSSAPAPSPEPSPETPSPSARPTPSDRPSPSGEASPSRAPSPSAASSSPQEPVEPTDETSAPPAP